MNPFDALVETVRSQLSGTETSAELEGLLAAAGIPDTMFEELMLRIKPSVPPPVPPSTPPSSHDSNITSSPQLLVDWGMHPQVGHQSRPCFMVLAPAYSGARLNVELQIDDALDFPEASSDVRVLSLGEGQWEFHVSFGLTTNGSNCRPGQYLIQVRAVFDDLTDTALPRYFQSTIRLNIGESGGAGPTLEIEGDGQSIVNLHGQDLRSFGRVVLRGNDAGIINLQGANDSHSPLDHEQDQSNSVTFEYELKVDLERQAGLPTAAAGFHRQRLETASLIFEDGRRILLLPKKRVTLGRNRDNDIVIRWLPRSADNDALSRNISRTHLILTLSEDGLLLTDDSKSGTALDFDPIDGDRLMTLEEGDDPLDLELGITQRLRLDPFLGQLQLFGSELNSAEAPTLDGDRTYCAAVGETVSRLLRLSHDSRIDAVRLQRVNNLADREEYVCLYRQALIGASHDRCAVTLSDSESPAVAARIVYIGRTFWLESLCESDTVSMNDCPLKRLQLAPLSVGAKIAIGGTTFRFEMAEQTDGEN